MTYDGKQPHEMTAEELEAALIYCHRHMMQAERLYHVNQAAIVEISEEIDRRERPELLN